MDTKSLERIGLTQGEIKVYIALLKISPSTVGNIIKGSQVSSSKVYDILDRLNKKGLVGVISKNNTKLFEAKNPDRIKEFIELRERELRENKKEVEKALPELQSLYKNRESTQEAEILQGTNGIKTFTEMIISKLEKGDTFYILGAPRESTELLGPYFKEWHDRRAKKGIKCKIIYNKESEERAKKIGKLPLTETRIMQSGIITPAIIDIGKDYVATLVFGDRPLVFVIKNKKVSESYLTYFELLWKVAKK